VRAVVHDRYGPPEVLRLEEVEHPVPGDDELLVRVHATTVNRTDCHRRGASPFLWRLLLGLRRPRQRVLGMEFAGVVEAVGYDVLLLKQLLEDSEYRAVIDLSYRLEDIVDANRYVETQQKTGNVVLTVSGDRKT
jgi:NADPH:quinone reductase-like Zn-dependent oxidoreductase